MNFTTTYFLYIFFGTNFPNVKSKNVISFANACI